MNVAFFEELLKRTIGLDAASIGQSAVVRAVRERMNALQATDADAYADLVARSPEEKQALVETVVVPETWFFRDPEAFALLTRRVHDARVRQHEDRLIRALSVPCATGEEPYSIAMALLDAGLPLGRFEIDAVDVSERSLSRARDRSYGRNSFRGAGLGFRERYFRPHDARWLLSESVQTAVRFERGNLLDPSFTAGRTAYDFVFCRNLLIYFDRPTQDKAVGALHQLLAPTGTLFVGPSETALLLSHGFELVRAPLAFAMTRPLDRPTRPNAAAGNTGSARTTRERPRPKPAPTRAPGSSGHNPGPRLRNAPIAATAAPRSPTNASRGEPVVHEPLDEIARLANAGHFAEAARQCEHHIRAHGTSPKSLYLLAVIRDAGGLHDEAAALYRKALYLDPEHHDALMHLGYLLAAAGDKAGAQVLTNRAQRVAQKRKASA